MESVISDRELEIMMGMGVFIAMLLKVTLVTMVAFTKRLYFKKGDKRLTQGVLIVGVVLPIIMAWALFSAIEPMRVWQILETLREVRPDYGRAMTFAYIGGAFIAPISLLGLWRTSRTLTLDDLNKPIEELSPRAVAYLSSQTPSFS